jgi:hypothetical protein
LPERLGGRDRDAAQPVRVDLGVERRQMTEHNGAIRDVVEHRIGNIAVLNAEPPRESWNFARQHIGGASRAKDRFQCGPILVAGPGLTRAGQHDPRNLLTELGQIVDIGQLLSEQEAEPAMTRKYDCVAIDNAGLRQLTQGCGAGHDQVWENVLIRPDRQDRFAELNAAAGQHVDDHRLRQGDDQDLARIGVARARAAAPVRESIEDERQQHRIMVALGEDREFRAAVERADEIRQRVSEAVEAEQSTRRPEGRPGNALGHRSS